MNKTQRPASMNVEPLVQCCRSQHLQEIRDELLSISDKLLDGDASEAEVPALKARRLDLIALRTELEMANPAQPNIQPRHQQGTMPHQQQPLYSQVLPINFGLNCT